MRVLYTFVLDGDPRFFLQGRIFMESTIASAIPRYNIIAQVTGSSGAAGHALAASYGVCNIALPFGPDGRYCNKTMPLFNLTTYEYDVLFACDTDVAILEPFDHVVGLNAVRAKRVDGENPRLVMLEELRTLLGVNETPIGAFRSAPHLFLSRV